MALLKTILILLLIYYGIKILARLFAPKIVNYAAKKTEAHFRSKFGDAFQQHTAKSEQEGDVIIQKRNTKKSNPQKKVGDYIDFEEID